MIRVLVADDSAFMRNAISNLLAKDPEIEVVGVARDGLDCLEKVKQHDPDVVTLDIEMPRMNGLEALLEIMRILPLPVIMISSVNEAETTLKALEGGALDFIPKAKADDREAFGEEIRRKVKMLARRKAFVRLKHGGAKMPVPPAASASAAGSIPRTSSLGTGSAASARGAAGMHPGRPAGLSEAPRPMKPAFSGTAAPERPHISRPTSPMAHCRGARDLVVIGVSTGGPPVVQKVLAALPAKLPACILIAQHMPASFTGPFAKRLDNVCQISVTEAVNGDKIVNGHAYVCPGGQHIGIQMHGPLPEVLVTKEPTNALYKPTVNVLMETAGRCLGRRVLGVMLTGMGSDGVDGARVLKEKGGWLIAQNEASCVVYGMPKAVVDAGLADQVLDANEIAEAIIAAVKG